MNMVELNKYIYINYVVLVVIVVSKTIVSNIFRVSDGIYNSYLVTMYTHCWWSYESISI